MFVADVKTATSGPPGAGTEVEVPDSMVETTDTVLHRPIGELVAGLYALAPKKRRRKLPYVIVGALLFVGGSLVHDASTREYARSHAEAVLDHHLSPRPSPRTTPPTATPTEMLATNPNITTTTVAPAPVAESVDLPSVSGASIAKLTKKKSAAKTEKKKKGPSKKAARLVRDPGF